MSTSGLMRFLQLRWIGQHRLRAYSVILFLGSLVSIPWAWHEAMGPIGSDFLAFWSAGRLVVEGAAASAYDTQAAFAVQAALGRNHVFAFVNPPPFLFLAAPLGLLSYKWAWLAWVVATFGFWFAMAREWDRTFAWPIAAYPGALVAAWHAQTGLLTGGFMAGAASLLRKRPFTAGLCVGALVIKPHLAVLFPIAFAAGRQWRAFAGAAVSAVGLVLLAWIAFGTDTMLAYPQSWAISRELMDKASTVFLLRQTTVYAAVRVATSADVATAAQGFATVLAAVVTWRAWSRPGPAEGKLALLFAAAPLATPYLFSYDLPFLVIPTIWLARQARTLRDRPWERPLVLFFYVSPMFARALALPLGANIMPWLQVWMLWVVWRRLEASAAQPDTAG